jgi:hypothetical protein
MKPCAVCFLCYPAISAFAGEPQRKLTIERDGVSSTTEAANLKNKAAPVNLLDGKLKIDIAADFSLEPGGSADKKTAAEFSREGGAWGEVLRGTHGLTPDKLDGYVKMWVAEYSKGYAWLPKGYHLPWLRRKS